MSPFRVVCRLRERGKNFHFVFYSRSGIWAAVAAPLCGVRLRLPSLGDSVRLPSPARRRAAPLPWAACAQQAVAPRRRAAGKQRLRWSVAARSGHGKRAGKQRQRAIPAAAGKAKERPADRDPDCCVLLVWFFFKLLHPEFRARQETWLLMVS
jgi:hypothetical protein